MRKLLTSKKRNFCYFFTLLSVSAMAFSLVSCGGISKEILDKQINIKKGNEFATGYSLKDVLTSASSSTARSKFSSALVDQILYNWYADFAFGKNSSASYPTTRIQSFADKWSGWYTDLAIQYDDRIAQYKIDYKDNWTWYFENEFLAKELAFGDDWAYGKTGELIQHTSQKDSYIKNKMYEKIRGEVPTLFFSSNYFGLPLENQNGSEINYATPSSTATIVNEYEYSPKYRVVKGNSVKVKEISKEPQLWHLLDFYAKVDDAVGSTEKTTLGWQYAYIQRYTFNKYLQVNHPVSTTMSLWKNTPVEKITGGWEKIYNKDYVASEQRKTNWEFPWWEDTGSSGPKHGPNEQFLNFIKEGFGNNNSDNATYFPHSWDTTNKAGLVSIPVNSSVKYTDDSGTLFKVNLSGDAYSSTFIPYAATAAELWLGKGTAASLPQYTRSGGSDKTFFLSTNATIPIFSNFVFTNTTFPTKLSNVSGASAVTAFGKWNSSLNTNVKRFLNQDIVTTGTSPVVPHAKIFNPDSDMYKDGYVYTISGYQLPSLPFVLIKERGNGDDSDGSGVHFIGLDGYKYLKDTNTSDATTGLNNNGDAWSYNREIDILKYRSYEDLFLQESIVGSGFDLTAGNRLMDFFNSNMDDIIIDMFNSTINATDPILASSPIFNPESNQRFLNDNSNHDKWDAYYALVRSMRNFNAYINLQSNLSSSIDKFYEFNAKMEANALWRAGGQKTDHSFFVASDDIYSNGIATNLPFNFLTSTSIITDYRTRQLTQKIPYACVQTLEMAYDGKNNSFVFASDFVTLSTTIANIQSTYRDFYATLDIRPNINNIRDIGYNHYLEYIYSNNYASNSMLSNYRDIGVFSNMAISRYYEDYLNNNKNVQSYNFFDANQMLNPSSTFGSGSATDFMTNLHDALLVKYYAPYSLTADKLDQYNIFHSSGGANAINLYKEIGLSSWISQNKYLLDGKDSSNYLNYLKMAANLTYLFTNSSNQFDPTRFVEWLRKKIDFGEQSVFAWTSKDYLGYPISTSPYVNDFSNATIQDVTAAGTKVESIYGWKSNYLNVFDNTYKSSNDLNSSTVPVATYDNTQTTHVANDKYLNLAKYRTGAQLTGYMGLLTSANTNIDVNFAKYFNNFENANPQDNNLGALYHYRELSKTSSGYDYVDINTVDLTDPTIRFTLYGLIASYKDDLAALKVLSSKINNLIPDFEEINQKIQGDVDLWTDGRYGPNPNQVTPNKQAQGLICALFPGNVDTYNSDWNKGTYNINNYFAESADRTAYTTTVQNWFKSLNNNNTLVELKNPSPLHNTSKAIFNDGDAHSRYAFAQFSYIDLLPTDLTSALSSTISTTIFNNLVTKFGSDIIYQLVYDAMADSNVQSYLESDVIKYIKSNNKLIEAFDRSFNDQVGNKWLKNYKEKN